MDWHSLQHSLIDNVALEFGIKGSLDNDDVLADILQRTFDMGIISSLIEELQREQMTIETLSKQRETSRDEIVIDAVKKTYSYMQSLQDIHIRACSMREDVQQEMDKVQPIIGELEPMVEEITRLDTIRVYVQAVVVLKSISKSNTCSRDELVKLVETLKSLRGLNSNLSLTKFVEKELQRHVKQTRISYEKVILEELKKIRWPLTQPGTKLDASNTSKLIETLKRLNDLQILFESKNVSANEETRHLWMVKVMCRPIVQRFNYHFSGDRSTNRIDKPEWYLEFIKDMVKSHAEFLVNNIHPQLGMHVDLISHFIRHLIFTVHSHLDVNWEFIKVSNSLLCHTLDELVTADEFLQSQCGYVSTSLTEDETGMLEAEDIVNFYPWPSLQYFFISDTNTVVHWIQCDVQFGHSKIDGILADENAWRTLAATMAIENTIDDMHMPECCENILAFFQTLHARCNRLPVFFQLVYVSHVIVPLLQHVTEVLGQRAGTLVQQFDVSDLTTILDFVVMLNGVASIQHGIVQWQDSEQYININSYYDAYGTRSCFLQKLRAILDALHPKGHNQLRLFRKKSSISDHSAVLEQPKAALHQLIEQNSTVMARLVYDKCSQQLMPFAKKCQKASWWQGKPIRTHPSDEIRQTHTHLFNILMMLSKSMSKILRHEFAQQLSGELSEYFIQNCINKCKFDYHGGLNLEVDFKYLCTSFIPLSPKPENMYFRKLGDFIRVLHLPNTSLNSLVSALESLRGNGEAKGIIEDGYQIMLLSAQDILGISKLRMAHGA